MTFHPSVCPHDCPSVCALEVERLPDGRLGKVRGSERNPFTAGVVCAKVARYHERYHHPDRLGFPLQRTGAKRSGEFRRISWEAALDEIAENFLRIEQRHGAEAIWPYWYAGTMGLVQRDGIERLTHVKKYSRFKSTICVALSDAGFKAGHGRRWGVPATEIAQHSDLVVVWGTNPVHTHVNMMTHIARARKERGAKLVVVDPYRSATAEEAASILDSAQSVVVVPGYGMAVAQAQHKVRELYDSLTKRGVDVKFAIHPVAGRMPGHMNVLLAEADIPYDKLIEMDEINPEMNQTDVALIIGANDVTNPCARTDKTSPIYGMPIIDVDKCKTVIANKRTMNPGFAGIDNELYFGDRTWMLFGDAKAVVGELAKQLAGGSGLH